MKNLTRLILLTAVLAAATSVSRAQTFPVSAQLTLQQQGDSRLVNGVYTDKVRTQRLNSYSLLAMLAAAYPSEYPNGFPSTAKLMLVDFSHFQVQTYTGAILITNTAPYLTYSDTFSHTNFLYQGKEDTLTGALKHTYYYQATVQFNDFLPDGISFSFTGNVLEKYSRTTADYYGDRLAQGSQTITGVGSGKVGEGFFLLTGKVRTPTMKWIETDL